MSWAKFDDHFDDDPDCDIVGGAGIALFICSVTWISRHMTDGFIPTRRAHQLPCGNDNEAISKLLQVGWWEQVEGGYQIRNYLKYNPSREKVLAEREATLRRQTEFQSRKKSPDNGVNPQNHNAVNNGVSDTVNNGVNNTAPVPVPVPVPEEESTSPNLTHTLSDPTAPKAESVGVNQEGFNRFWAAYPHKSNKQHAIRAWDKLKPDDKLLGEILAAIAEQKTWDQWQRGIYPHPATWLNSRRWEDEPPPAPTITRPPPGKPPAMSFRQESALYGEQLRKTLGRSQSPPVEDFNIIVLEGKTP